MDAAAFEASFITFDATVMNLQVIGESVAKLPETLKAAVAEPPPWGQIVAVRNLVSHGYPDIDPDVIWTIVTPGWRNLSSAWPECQPFLRQVKLSPSRNEKPAGIAPGGLLSSIVTLA